MTAVVVMKTSVPIVRPFDRTNPARKPVNPCYALQSEAGRMSTRHLTVACLLVLLPAVGFGADRRLADAAEHGDQALVRLLIERGADVNAKGVDEATALHHAVHADQLKIAEMLLRVGADPAARDRYGVTPLYLASLNGNADMIQRLLDAGVDPNIVDATGETPLMTAARNGHPSALRVLLARGARVDARDPEFEQTALMIAVRENHSAAVELLLGAGAGVNAQTRKGPTPKFVPPCKGTGCGSEGVGINRGGLPDRGRRADAKGGMTPLLYAARDGRLAAARMLVAAGADIELAEANGIRPLLMAVLNNNLMVARVLLDHGADVNADDFWGRSPLWAAVEYRNLDMNNRDQGAARCRRQCEQPDAGSAPEPALALLPGRRLVGGLHRADAVPESRAVRRHRHDAAAAPVRRRSEPPDIGQHDASHGGCRCQLGGRANLHGVAAGAPGCGRALSGAWQ
jgi:ankyrin repeat protein